MGDNATASWAWHNTIVGQGYQAKGVVRQPGSNPVKVLDLRLLATKEQAVATPSEAKSEDAKKSKKKRKERDNSRDDKEDRKKKSKKSDRKETKEKKNKKKKKSSSKDKSGERDPCPLVSKTRDNFNPLLQYLATCLSNRTRVFSLSNE